MIKAWQLPVFIKYWNILVDLKRASTVFQARVITTGKVIYVPNSTGIG